MKYYPNLIYVIVGVVIFSLLLHGICPGVYWGDDGLLISASVTLGIGHPPGHPLYMMINRCALVLPFGDIAFRFNIMAALWLSLALALLAAWLKTELGASRWSRLIPITLIVFPVIHPFSWHQAVRAETYSLHVLLLIVCLWSIFNLRNFKGLLLSAFVSGLMLGNQLLLASLAGPGLVFAWIWLWNKLGSRTATMIRAAILFLFGLSVYLYPVIRAGTKPKVAWAILDGHSSILSFITASNYRSTFFSSSSVANHFGDRITILIADLARSSGFLMCFLFIIGLAAVPLLNRRNGFHCSLSVAMIILGTVIGTAMCVDYNVRNWDFQGYLLPVIVLMPVVPAFSVERLIRANVHCRWLVPIVCLIAGTASWVPEPVGGNRSLRECFEPSLLASSHLDAALPDSLCLTRSDVGFIMIYRHIIELFRDDLTVVSRGFLMRTRSLNAVANQYPEIIKWLSEIRNTDDLAVESLLEHKRWHPLYWELADDDRVIENVPARLTGSLAELNPEKISFVAADLQFERLLRIIQKENSRIFKDQQAVEQLSMLFYNRGTFLLSRGKPENAVREFESAIGIDSEQSRIHNNYGVALAELDRVEESCRAFQRALELDPDHPGALNNLDMLRRYSTR